MVCIAAFIVLAICVLSIPVLRIFNKKAADTIWKLFKKSVYCFTHRVTFRKCDSTFKDDIKNTVLRKVVVKHSNWVKPLGVTIEVLSVVIICVTVWSLLVAFKSGVTLAAYGTCDVVTPEACAVGDAEACYAGGAKDSKNIVEWTGNWFVEIGEAIVAIPPRLANWEVPEYLPENPSYLREYDESKPLAIDIFDPGCQWCRVSFKNQRDSGFFDKYNVTIIPYALFDDGVERFANSDLIVRYLEAIKLTPLESAETPIEWKVIERIFTGNNEFGLWQEDFKSYYDEDGAKGILNDWLKEFGYSKQDVVKITTLVESEEVAKVVEHNRDIVENQVKIVKIPTMLFDNKRHDGVYKP
jgi:hypothetical protein